MESNAPGQSVLVALAACAGFAWGFAAFGSALWANLYVDGHEDAATADVLTSVLPLVALFLLPGVAVTGAAVQLGAYPARRTFGAAGMLLPLFLVPGYTAAALSVAAAPWAVSRLARRQGLARPPLDVLVIAAGLLLIMFWCYAEAHRA